MSWDGTFASASELGHRAQVEQRLATIRAAIVALGVEVHEAEYRRLDKEYRDLIATRPIRAWRELARSHPDNVRADELSALKASALSKVQEAARAIKPLREKEAACYQWLDGSSTESFDSVMAKTTEL